MQPRCQQWPCVLRSSWKNSVSEWSMQTLTLKDAEEPLPQTIGAGVSCPDGSIHGGGAGGISVWQSGKNSSVEASFHRPPPTPFRTSISTAFSPIPGVEQLMIFQTPCSTHLRCSYKSERKAASRERCAKDLLCRGRTGLRVHVVIGAPRRPRDVVGGGPVVPGKPWVVIGLARRTTRQIEKVSLSHRPRSPRPGILQW